jgi:hypothetical protein
MRREHELQTGGETHETTLSKHYQIPRFGADSDSPSSSGSFSKCGPWSRGRWVALHATDTRRRDKQRQKRDRAVCEEENAPRVEYGVCGEAGLCEVARRRRLQPQLHGGLAARRAANAGEDVVGTPLGLKAGDVEASCLPAGLPPSTRTQRRPIHNSAGRTAGHSSRAWRSVSSCPAARGLRAGWGRHAQHAVSARPSASTGQNCTLAAPHLRAACMSNHAKTRRWRWRSAAWTCTHASRHAGLAAVCTARGSRQSSVAYGLTTAASRRSAARSAGRTGRLPQPGLPPSAGCPGV